MPTGSSPNFSRVGDVHMQASGIHQFGKAGYFSRGGFLVDDTLLCRLVNDGLRNIQFVRGVLALFLADSQTHIFDNMLDPGPGRLIALTPNFVLTGTF